MAIETYMVGTAVLIPPHEAARILRVSVSTLSRLRKRGEGPKFTKVAPRKIWYDAADVRRLATPGANTPAAAAARAT